MPDLTPGDPRERIVPLTYEQEWYHANIRRSTRARRNVRLSYEIRGPFDPDAFTEAVHGFVARHDALRMDLVARPGADAPAQRVRPLAPGERIVLHQSVTAASERQFTTYASALHSRDFLAPWADGERPYTFRLLRYADDHHAFLATFQNVVFDGRAHELFARETWRDYRTLLAGGSPPLAAPSFAEAALRQRGRYGAGHLDRARESWRERLEFAARTAWNRPGHAEPTSDGTVHAQLAGEDAVAFHRACERLRCTAMQLLVASFVRALSACAGADRVTVWTSMDSRQTAERDVVGMFAGVSPLAVRAAGADLPDVLVEVRRRMLDALRYQQIPASELSALAAESAADGADPLRRDVHVNLRRFDGPYRPTERSGPLRVTADAYPLRRITFGTSSALHLRCNEYRDRVLVDLVFDGRRVGRPLAQALLDRMVRTAVAPAETPSTPSTPRTP
ncbi:condensation domain-containing protein [Streptomyces sp. NPDC046870]|uniref:condensation domain-containing protein n=1 Tax=Streptomyces sp. NPDC046870 TaxID=3155135 RepID=UPI00345539B5